MRELSLPIEVFPLRQNKDQRKFILNANDYYHLQILKTSSNAGTLIDCNQSIIIDKPEESVLREFNFPRSSIVTLTDSKGKIIQIGTDVIPALVTIIPGLNTAKLEISCKMLNSPLL